MLRFVGLVFAARVCVAADAPPQLVTVCDVLQNPKAYDHHAVFVIGKLAKRESGRWVGQDVCEAGVAKPRALAVRFDRQSGPLPSDQVAIDSEIAKRKFKQMAENTSLHDFRFGSGDYDRWAVVFGRVELDGGPSSPVIGTVVCRGEALIFFWAAGF